MLRAAAQSASPAAMDQELCVCVCVCVCVCLSICLSVCLSICLSVYLSVSLRLSLSLSVCLSFFLSLSLSLSPPPSCIQYQLIHTWTQAKLLGALQSVLEQCQALRAAHNDPPNARVRRMLEFARLLAAAAGTRVCGYVCMCVCVYIYACEYM